MTWHGDSELPTITARQIALTLEARLVNELPEGWGVGVHPTREDQSVLNVRAIPPGACRDRWRFTHISVRQANRDGAAAGLAERIVDHYDAELSITDLVRCDPRYQELFGVFHTAFVEHVATHGDPAAFVVGVAGRCGCSACAR